MYTHTQYEVKVADDAALDAAGDKGSLTPGYVPHIIRAVAVAPGAAVAGGAVVKVDKRLSDGSRGDGDVAVVTLPASDLGDVIFVDDLNVEIKPGEEAVAEVTTAGGVGEVADIVFYVEPRWELSGNNLSMIESL